MLSNTCKYAIRACIYLALNADEDKKIGIKKISEDLNIPTPFLGKILQVLAKNKILASTKGPNGGFSLGKPAKKISLMDIVTIIDGDDSFNSCVIGVVSCTTAETHCPIHEKYGPIRDQAKNLFMQQDIEELAQSIKKNHNNIII
jgi:Rrf2 family transcriptional regulator, iron-sulfur cluster assembly transcription factor